MTRALARFGGLATAAVMIVAGCQPGIPPSAAPSSPATPTATAAAVATATPTPTVAASPTVAPEPTGSPVPCPSALPTTVSVDALADPSCYGTTELTIDAWLAETPIWVDSNEPVPSWTIPTSGLFAESPTVASFAYDFLMANGGTGVSVVATPTSGIDLSGLGRWVTVRGHFNDPAVLACTTTLVDDYPDEYAKPDCSRLFLATSLEPLTHRQRVCPSTSLTITAFMAADATCFIGREVHVTGWEDVGEGFGGAASVYPVDTGTVFTFADAQLISHRWESDLDKVYIFPWLLRGSGVRFDRSDTKVIVTGQLGHPASKDCRPHAIGWTWVPPLDWAQDQCRHLFVITGVQLRS